MDAKGWVDRLRDRGAAREREREGQPARARCCEGGVRVPMAAAGNNNIKKGLLVGGEFRPLGHEVEVVADDGHVVQTRTPVRPHEVLRQVVRCERHVEYRRGVHTPRGLEGQRTV